MLRVTLAVLALLFAGAPLAAAQPTAADFASAAAMRDASISPDGNYIVAIQGIPGGEALVVIDWRRRQAQQLRTVSHERGMFLESAAWKGNDRVLFQVRQRTMLMSEGTGSRNRREGGEIDIVRYYATNRNGANLTQLFENNRLASRNLSIRLIDVLEDDPEHVLMGTWGSAGFTLYRVDVNNGRTAAVEDAAWETVNMIVNRSGRAIMRVDALPYRSGYRYYRRPASGGGWTVAHEVRRGQRSQNRDFYPDRGRAGAVTGLRRGPSRGARIPGHLSLRHKHRATRPSDLHPPECGRKHCRREPRGQFDDLRLRGDAALSMHRDRSRHPAPLQWVGGLFRQSRRL